MEQQYILKNADSFELKDIFECGQCFRWNEEIDGSYTGIFGNNVLNVSKSKNDVIFKGICNENIKDICNKYFDLDTDYSKIKSSLSKIDENMAESIKYGKGIRILNQELWETIISFEISANNNIPRIKGIIERLSEKYGKELKWNGKKYYTFPTCEELKNVEISEFRKLGLGFRDKRIYDTVHLFLNNEMNLEELIKIKDTAMLKEKLLKLPGVGPKVADCILLFALHRVEVFPIDVWVRRVMNELYIHNSDESKVSRNEIEKIAIEKFGNIGGLAQQYLFYYRRSLNSYNKT